jgi:MFS family permease
MEIVINYFRRLQKAASLNFLIQIADNFGLAFAEYYFKLHGVSLPKLILIYALGPLASIPIVVFCNNWKIQRYMRYGILGYIAMSLSLLFYTHISYLLFGIFNGVNLGFFWVSINYIFFLKSQNDTNAKDSSIYFILGPLVGIILPPLGALVISGIGYRALFFIGILLFMLPLLYVKNEAFNHHIKHSFAKANRAYKGLKTITFLEQTIYYFQGNFLFIYALFFLSNQYQVGGLLSYLALTSLIVAFVLSHVSDRSKKRVEILYPIMIAMSILILIIPGLKDLSTLLVVGGIYAFIDNLSLPIRFAVPLDLAKDVDIGFWRASEFYGNIGRASIFGIAALLLFMDDKYAAFGMFAAITFIAPFVISRKTASIRNRQLYR